MFLDTSVIVELLTAPKGSERSVSLLHHMTDEPLTISALQFGELSDWCYRNSIDPFTTIQKIKEIVSVLPLDEKIILHGSRLKHNRRTHGFSKFSLADGIILASSIDLNEPLLTLDQDFNGLENVIVHGT